MSARRRDVCFIRPELCAGGKNEVLKRVELRSAARRKVGMEEGMAVLAADLTEEGETDQDDLLREIEAMRQEHAGLQDENDTLQESNKDLERMHHDQSVILDILANNGHVNEVVDRLRNGERRESIAQRLRDRPELRQFIDSVSGSDKHLIAVVGRVEGLYDRLASPSYSTPSTHRWTRVTENDALIHHLFELYFTWVHPVHMLFGEVDFLQSFRTGDETYCSAALVNAICAMACHLLEKPAPGLSSRGFQDRDTLRDGFMAEARNLLPPGSSLPMTSIQAFAIMFLADLSAGKARVASGYLRCAADNLRSPQESFDPTKESMELSRWGIHTMNTAWSGITYQKPFNPVSPQTEVFFNVDLDKDASLESWRNYRQPGDEANIPKQQSFAILTACYQAKLYRVVHDTINVYCGARGKVTAKAVIGCYRRFVDWKSNLPEQIARTDEESKPLPHVLALHVQYRVALIQLLAPLIHCGHFGKSEENYLQKEIVEHARAGLQHIAQCDHLYSCRYGMPIAAFCILHMGDTLIQFSADDPPASDVVSFVSEVMQQNRNGFPLCGPLQQMFQQRAKKQGVEIRKDGTKGLAAPDHYGVDSILDACTRLEYAQPVDQIRRYIDRSIGEHWQEEWNRQMSSSRTRRQSASERSMHITSLLNDD
ncbi:hypothetical protein MMC13_007214 [Lambiella insularis]|nr:hypothetical protein [Lambiella insularis]